MKRLLGVCFSPRLFTLLSVLLAFLIPGQSSFAASGNAGNQSRNLGVPKAPDSFEINTNKYSSNELLVKFRSGLSERRVNQSINKRHATGSKKFSGKRRGRRTSAIDSWRHIQLPAGADIEQVIADFASDPDVERVEPNYEITTFVVPNDPRFQELWGMHNIGQTGGINDADIDAPEAWDIKTGSESVLVAVIDTGVDYNHEDLIGNIWTNPGEIAGNGIDDDGNGFIDDIHGYDFANNDGDPRDDNGHGTHCAGTISGVGNNGIGITGVSWNARIMAVKFLNSSGSGSVSNAVKAVMYASSMGVKVMSNSWGGGGYSQALLDAINDANNAGALFVAAAGNNGRNTDVTPTYPQGYDVPNVLSVAATDNRDNKASFSNYGALSVDLGAPGVSILSSVPTGTCRLCDSTGYRLLNGTSMATPHVSGAAALLLSVDPSLPPDELKSILMASVDPIAALNGITVSGGRLNVNAALNSVANAPFRLAVSPDSPTVVSGQSTETTVTVTSLRDFSLPVNLTFESTDTGITGSFSESAVTPPMNGEVQTTLTISTTNTTPSGSYKVTIVGSNEAGESYSAQAILVVDGQDFELVASPATQPGKPGGSTTYEIQINSLNAYSSTVSLSLSSTNQAISGSISPAAVTLPADGSSTSLLTVDVAAGIPAGEYLLTVTATDGTISHSTTVALSIVDIDYEVTNVNTSTASVLTGNQFALSATVRNSGTSASSTYTNVDFYLSTDNTIATDDVLLASRSVAPLGSGASYTATATVTVPVALTGGTYYLGAIGDSTNAVDETDESNNTWAGNTIIINRNVDLLINTVSTTATSVSVGQTITISSTVSNNGLSDSGPTTLRFYLSKDSLITTADVVLGDLSIAPLSGRTSSTIDATVSIPTGIAGGNYYIGAIADYDNQENETYEANNARTGTQIQVANDVDFIVSALTTSTTSISVGESVILSNTISNVGATTSSPTFVYFYLSRDNVITQFDILIGSRTAASLTGGASDTADTTITLPLGLGGGTYYIGAIVDRNNLQPESNEDNNTLAGDAIEVVHDVDFVVNEVSTANNNVSLGEQISIASTVSNSGSSNARATTVGFYLSTDDVVTTGDILLGSRATSTLATGASDSASLTITIPTSLSPGTYYLGAVVDINNSEAETNEDNNSLLAGAMDVYRNFDLIVDSISTSATSMPVNEAITVSTSVTNQGTSPGKLSTNLGLYLSTDATITTSDTLIRTLYIPPLSSGASSSSDVSAIIPGALVSGTYYLGAIADYNNSESESNESNNSRVAGTIEVINDVDLAATAISTPAAQVSTGEQFTLTSTVTNLGVTTAAATTLRFYLSTDNVITTSDSSLGSRTVPALIGGATSTTDTVVTMPTSLSAGTYYLGVIADSTNTINETNENNNIFVGQTIEVVKDIDLVVQSISTTAANVSAGESVTLSSTINNNGTSTSSAFIVGFYLSTDATVTTSDQRIGTLVLSNLAGGASNTTNTTVTISSNMATGSYYLGAIVDLYNLQAESDETNNTTVGGAIEVIRDIDLVVNSLSTTTTSGATGSPIAISSSVSNNGASISSSWLGFFLSTDNVITTSDTFLGRYQVSNLAGGTTVTIQYNGSIPASINAGTYYLGAIADYDNQQSETNENNNAFTAELINVQRDVDFTVTDVTTSSTNVSSGQYISLSSTVNNIGGSAAGYTDVAFYLSTDNVITTSDVLIGNQYVPALASGGNYTATTSVYIPATTAAGTYYLGAIADYLNRQVESNENNNSVADSTIDVIRDLDIVMDAVSTTASDVYTGDSIAVNSTVSNTGTSSTYSFYVGFYLSTDNVIDTNDILVGYRSLNLMGGTSSTVDSSIVIPSTVATGTYYLGAIADYKNVHPDETSENNNIAIASTALNVVRNIDLVMESVSTTATTATRGQPLTLNGTISNADMSPAPSFWVRFYLSTDDVITTQDVYIGYWVVPSLAGGASSTADISGYVNSSVPTGTYRLGAIVDNDNVIVETNENNNTQTGGLITVK